jgi:hypothetical protein
MIILLGRSHDLIKSSSGEQALSNGINDSSMSGLNHGTAATIEPARTVGCLGQLSDIAINS